jgi:hypothetical protein
MPKNLFLPVVNKSKLNINFQRARTWPGAEPHRVMMNEIFQEFPDPDGNFIEQFQTTAFDSRIFELYLFAYLHRSGYEVSRKYKQPDFIVGRDGTKVAIEATTVNPSQQRTSEKTDEEMRIPTLQELVEKLNNELPIKYGSPLFSKLRQKYWELEQCKEIPIIFAIEAFHEKESLFFASYSLAQYLYGMRTYPTWTESGKLIVTNEPVESHFIGEKVIPSRFFGYEGTEYISAILFSNSGTFPKFGRMGYQAGYHRGNIIMQRTGTCYNPDPNSATPLLFSYDLDNPFIEESWGQGLVVLLNQNALHPLPRDFFIDAAQCYIKDDNIMTDVPQFHPMSSLTMIAVIEDKELQSIDGTEKLLGTILKREFDDLFRKRHPITELMAEEKEWFTDKNRTIWGVTIRDRQDDDYLYIVLGKDEKGDFRAISTGESVSSREEARKNLLKNMEEIICTGQKIFPQGD